MVSYYSTIYISTPIKIGGCLCPTSFSSPKALLNYPILSGSIYITRRYIGGGHQQCEENCAAHTSLALLLQPRPDSHTSFWRVFSSAVTLYLQITRFLVIAAEKPKLWHWQTALNMPLNSQPLLNVMLAWVNFTNFTNGFKSVA